MRCQSEVEHQSPITIGHTIYAFKEGGMERGLLNIVNYGDQDRFQHVIMCLTEAGEFARQIRSPSCKVIEFHKKPGNDFGLSSRIAKAVREYKIAILHARGWPTLLETALAARLAGVDATIYGFHGKTVSELAGLGALRRFAQAVALRSYDRVVTLNRSMREDLAAEAYLPEQSIDVISNGVDLDLFKPYTDKQGLRSRFGLPLHRFILGNVARLDPVKNHEVLLRALTEFQPSKRPFFLLVGEGEYRATIEDAVLKLGLTKDVHLIGYSNQTADLLNCVDVYVQPSHYEGFSNTILEAMACAIPIVATDVGGTRDLFSDQVEGAFFSPTDSHSLFIILDLLRTDHHRVREMGAAARRRAVQQFSIQRMVKNYETMYTSVHRTCA